jgi:hypothetical protein
MVLFLPIFMELSLTPKENGGRQAVVEPNLESLLPMPA